jgi:hypothetical protein
MKPFAILFATCAIALSVPGYSEAQDTRYTPPPQCTAWFDGCNHCSKGADGMVACTLMACMGEPAPGRCTAYEGDPKPEPAPNPDQAVGYQPDTGEEVLVAPESTGTATSVPGSEVVQESAETPDPGFFFGIWNRVASWFGNLF